MANPLQEIAGELDTIFMVVVAFLVLTWIVVGLRIYVRALLIKTFGYDDYSILIAQCFLTVTCGCTIFFVKATKDVLNGQSFGLPANFGIIIRLDTGFYVLSMIALKISLGIFFLKIFVASIWQRVVIHIIVAVSVLYGIVYFFMTMFSCALLTYFSANAGECSTEKTYAGVSTSWSVLNAVTDLLFSLISVLAIWSVNLPASAKVWAGGLLVLGTIGGIASCIRLGVILDPDDNRIQRGLISGRWTIIEIGVGIAAASSAALRPLLRWSMKRAKSSISSSPNNTAGGVVQSALGSSQRPAAPDWRMERRISDVEKGAASMQQEDDDKQSCNHSLQTHDLFSAETIDREERRIRGETT